MFMWSFGPVVAVLVSQAYAFFFYVDLPAGNNMHIDRINIVHNVFYIYVYIYIYVYTHVLCLASN